MKLVIAFLLFSMTSHAVVIGDPKSPQGGSFIYNMSSEPTTLNPINQTDAYSRYILEYVVSYLMVRNYDTWQYDPSIAEKVDISKDGLTFTFTLNKDAMWSDGQPVTAEDVKFSYDVIHDSHYHAEHMWAYYENIKSIEILNEHQIKFTVKEKYFKNLESICDTWIVPKHIYGDMAVGPTKNKTAIGSGPYRLVEYDQGKKLTLEKIENWWGSKVENFKGRYNFKNVIFKFIPDATIQVEALKKGDIDYIDGHYMSAETFVKRMDGPEWGKTVFKKKVTNRAPKIYGFVGWNLKKPLFKDRDVRVALAMLMNRNEMNEKFRYGMSLLATGPFLKESENADQSVKPFEFDPKKAAALLKKAGWSDPDKTGILSKMIDGKKTDFHFTIMYSSKDSEKYWTLYKEDLKKAGIQMDLKLVEWTSFNKSLDERTFDAFTMSWGGVVEEDPKQIWHSSSDVKGGSNYAGYSNPEVDKAIDQARGEMDDHKRSILMRKVYRLIAADAPYAFMFNPKYMFYGLSARVGQSKETFKYDLGDSYWYSKGSSAQQ